MMDPQILRFGLRLLTGKLLRKQYPFLVQLNITNRCNLRCRYCYGTYFDRPVEEMSFEDIKFIIDKLKESGVFRINLVGGEPLLRKDISKIISYISSKKIHCAITTNGYFVKENIEALKKLNSVCFSIDGKSENHDINRGKGSYAKAISGLEMCKENGIPVQISSVLNKQTVRDVDYMAELAAKYSCSVGFSVLISQKGESQNKEYIPEAEDVRSALKRICELKREGKSILFSEKSYQYAYNWPDYQYDFLFNENDKYDPINCYAGKFYCLIDYNGDVYPCPQLIGAFNPGNIFEHGYQTAMTKSMDHGCHGCPIPCSTDFNHFFDLNKQVLLDQYKSYGKS